MTNCTSQNDRCIKSDGCPSGVCRLVEDWVARHADRAALAMLWLSCGAQGNCGDNYSTSTAPASGEWGDPDGTRRKVWMPYRDNGDN
jgi:hypothetical protein